MRKKIILLFLLLSMPIAALSACKSNELYRITFDFNYPESKSVVMSVGSGEDLSDFAPHRESHRFLGWFKESKCINRFEPDNIQESLTLYAGWEVYAAESTCTVIFLGENIDIDKIEVKSGSRIYPPAVEREGHSPVWYNNGEIYDFSLPVSKDLSLTLSWMPDSRTVSFLGYGDEQLGSVSVKYGESVADAPEAAHEWPQFFRFSGWSGSIENVKQNLTVHAEFEYFPTADTNFIFELLDDGTYSIEKDESFDGIDHVALPRKYKGRPVTVIAGGGFDFAGITTAYIPGSIKHVRAFGDNENLTTVVMEEGVESIEGFAFSYCGSLEKMYIPASVRSISSWIFGMSDYPDCSLLLADDNPSYKVIDNSLYNFSVSKLLIANQYIERFVLPSTVTEMEYSRFADNRIIKEFVIEGNLKVLPAGTFVWSSLSTLTIKGSIETIGGSISKLAVDPMLTLTTKGPFDNCNLTELSLPDGLKRIEKAAMGSMSRLNTIILPASVEFIHDEAFGGSDRFINLKEIKMNTGTFSSNGRIRVENNTLFFSDEDGDTLVFYAAKAPGQTYTISSSVKRMLPAAFAGNQNLQTVLFEEGLEVISPRAFYDAVSLRKVVLPASLRRIESGLSNWAGIEYMVVRGSFEDTRKLTEVNFADTSLEYIGTAAFVGTGLSEIFIPASVSYIGMPNFYTMPESMDDFAALTTFFVEAGSPFYAADESGVLYSADFKKLICYPAGRSGHFTVPGGVEIIGKSAFTLAWQLTSLSLPDSVSRIEDSAFMYCIMLEKISFASLSAPYISGYNHFDMGGSTLEVELIVPQTAVADYFKAFVKQGYNSLIKITDQDLVVYTFVSEYGSAPAPVSAVSLDASPSVENYSGELHFTGWYPKNGAEGWGERILFPYAYTGGSSVTLYARFEENRYEDGSSFYFAYSLGLDKKNGRALTLTGSVVLYFYWNGDVEQCRLLDLHMDWDESIGYSPFDYAYNFEIYYPHNLERPFGWGTFGKIPLYLVVYFEDLPETDLTFYASDYEEPENQALMQAEAPAADAGYTPFISFKKEPIISELLS